jgi:hypothetical protein
MKQSKILKSDFSAVIGIAFALYVGKSVIVSIVDVIRYMNNP